MERAIYRYEIISIQMCKYMCVCVLMIMYI